MYVALDEKIKINSFTFGFELEAILNDTGAPTPKDGDVVEVDKELVMMRIPKLEPLLGLKEKFGGSYMRDGSIKPYSANHTPFEYVSGVLQFTDANVTNLTKTLADVKRKGVYTNKTCGFHIHFGFPNTTRKQLLWIKTVYLFDSLAQADFEYFQSSHGPIPFWSPKYASVGNKKKLSHDLANLIYEFKEGADDKFSSKVDRFFSQDYFTSKYNVLGIHEKYRTLEWRGPRGFLNTGEDKDIVNFINTVRKFVKWLSSAEDTERVVVDGKRGIFISREDFYALIEGHSQARIQTFGVDVADSIDKAKTNKAKADIAFNYFRTMDFSTSAATNYRKIANRIKARYPKAWEMFLKRAQSETTFPQQAKRFIQKLGRFLRIIHEENELVNPQTNRVVSFSEFVGR